MPDGVRGHNVARPITCMFILLTLGLLPSFAPSSSAAPGKQPSQPEPSDTTSLEEEQIVSTTDKITKPVDTDAEAMRHNDLGVAFVFKGDLGQAIDEFTHALRLQPNYFAAHLNLGNTLLDIGKHDEAIAELKAGFASQTRRPEGPQ